MKFERWNVAFRLRIPGSSLMDDQQRAFKVIPNTWRYWCADPHVVEHDGRHYIFAELYDRVLRRGVIGCCEIKDDRSVTPWGVVLKMPFHLSYPHIIKMDDAFYMIPESYVGQEIALYRAQNFPHCWKKVEALKSEYVAVDSTVFQYEEKRYMHTLVFLDDHEYFRMPCINDGKLSEEFVSISVDDPNKRPAGKLFWQDGKLIRPAQDCENGYGAALNFYRVDRVDGSNYFETLIQKIDPAEIRSDFSEIPKGIHTYNFDSKYEVIDLKSYETDILFYIMRPIWFVWRRIRKVFGH